MDEDDETVRISAAFASRASDSELAALNPQSLDVTITDDDERGVTVSKTALTLLEGGRDDLYGEAQLGADGECDGHAGRDRNGRRHEDRDRQSRVSDLHEERLVPGPNGDTEHAR